jgi:hypothetical protein
MSIRVRRWLRLRLRLSFRLVTLGGALVSSPAMTNAQPTGRFDHTAFDALLRAHVVNGMVDYGAFKSAPAFRSYLSALNAQDPAGLPRDEQLAFWINAYNAYTIQLINVHGETVSIRNINKTAFLKLKGPWSEPLAKVGGKSYTLDHIEHKIIRPTYKEPRIHFALVCAAMGCPPLRSEAYTGSKLNAQLDDQGSEFITKSPAKNRVDVASRTFFHSMIFGYYKEDFGGTIQGSAKFAARWFPVGSPERALLESGTFSATQTEYDWTLNSQLQAARLARPGAK